MATARESAKEYLSRSEVAAIFRVSPNTITRWAEAGKLPYVRTLGGHRRYDAAAVLKLARLMAGEEANMEQASFHIPNLYGDHHVTAVRQLLAELDGIEEVWASAAFQQVVVSYDPELVSAEDIAARLAENGYPTGDEQEQQEVRPRREKDPAWNHIGLRMTRTNRADIEMSGEFRRY